MIKKELISIPGPDLNVRAKKNAIHMTQRIDMRVAIRTVDTVEKIEALIRENPEDMTAYLSRLSQAIDSREKAGEIVFRSDPEMLQPSQSEIIQ